MKVMTFPGMSGRRAVSDYSYGSANERTGITYPMKKQRIIKAEVALGLCLWLTTALSASAFYHPTAGKWLSRDPIEERGGKNLCGFALNDPLNRTDALGLFGGSGGPRQLWWCCNGRYFNPFKKCCINGQLISKDEIGTGVVVWNQPSLPGIQNSDHVWFEWPDGSPNGIGSAGFNSPGNSGNWSSPDIFEGKPGPSATSYEVKLSPCKYDLFKFFDCVRTLGSTAPNPIPFDCNAYKNDIINTCKSQSEHE